MVQVQRAGRVALQVPQRGVQLRRRLVVREHAVHGGVRRMVHLVVEGRPRRRVVRRRHHGGVPRVGAGQPLLVLRRHPVLVVHPVVRRRLDVGHGGGLVGVVMMVTVVAVHGGHARRPGVRPRARVEADPWVMRRGQRHGVTVG